MIISSYMSSYIKPSGTFVVVGGGVRAPVQRFGKPVTLGEKHALQVLAQNMNGKSDEEVVTEWNKLVDSHEAYKHYSKLTPPDYRYGRA